MDDDDDWVPITVDDAADQAEILADLTGEQAAQLQRMVVMPIPEEGIGMPGGYPIEKVMVPGSQDSPEGPRFASKPVDWAPGLSEAVNDYMHFASNPLNAHLGAARVRGGNRRQAGPVDVPGVANEAERERLIQQISDDQAIRRQRSPTASTLGQITGEVAGYLGGGRLLKALGVGGAAAGSRAATAARAAAPAAFVGASELARTGDVGEAAKGAAVGGAAGLVLPGVQRAGAGLLRRATPSPAMVKPIIDSAREGWRRTWTPGETGRGLWDLGTTGLRAVKTAKWAPVGMLGGVATEQGARVLGELAPARAGIAEGAKWAAEGVDFDRIFGHPRARADAPPGAESATGMGDSYADMMPDPGPTQTPDRSAQFDAFVGAYDSPAMQAYPGVARELSGMLQEWATGSPPDQAAIDLMSYKLTEIPGLDYAAMDPARMRADNE